MIRIILTSKPSERSSKASSMVRAATSMALLRKARMTSLEEGYSINRTVPTS